MANEMNKVPCGGFKVGGGLSVNDGMLKMGSIVAAEVYIEGKPTSVGLLIPYKTIQFDNPIVTQTTRREDQTTTISVYDVFMGVELPFYKVILNENAEMKQVSINFDPEVVRPGLFKVVLKSRIYREPNIFDIFGEVLVNYLAEGKSINYIAVDMDIPDEIEEVLHFGGKGWLLENNS